MRQGARSGVGQGVRSGVGQAPGSWVEQRARPDAQLVTDAQAGDASAYAALLYRYGGSVRAAVDDDADPTRAVLDVFVAALRELPGRRPQAPVLPWLLGLAERRLGGSVPAVPPEQGWWADDGERDLVWSKLQARWPDGRRHRRAPRWLWWSLFLVALVGIGALVPYLVLASPLRDELEEPEREPEIVAEPLDEDEPGSVGPPEPSSAGTPRTETGDAAVRTR